MKIRIFMLILLLFLLMTAAAMPAFAYIADPLFGLSWRPDLCADNSSGFYICQGWYEFSVVQNNATVELIFAECGGNADNNPGVLACRVEKYAEHMGEDEAFTCIHPPGYYGPEYGDEPASWCIQLYEKWIADFTYMFGESGCNGACLMAKPPTGKKIILMIGEFIERRLAKPF